MSTDPNLEPSPLANTAEPDGIVVHLPHRGLVEDWLNANDAPVTGEALTDERLGLALLRVDVGGPLEPVLKDMRAHFEREYLGWVPLVGKNRHLTSVVGMPQPKPHFLTQPEAVNALPPAADPELGRGVRVGIADTRVFGHPDLLGRFVADRSALWRPSADEESSFRAGHATFVAGLVLHQAPAAELHMVDVLNDDGTGTMWDFATKLVALVDGGLDVLNLSLGCHTDDGKAPLVLSRAIQLISQRVVVVASAGNHGLEGKPSTPTWPAALPDVIAVGATNEEYSPEAPWITFTAPGRGTSTYFALGADGTAEAEYAEWDGTSFAAATATGVIAAKTVPGKASARDAVRALLGADGPVVRAYSMPS